MSESDLAKTLISSFDGSGYEIYQEVESPCGITDIVLKHANFIWAIEVKTSLSLSVLSQARNNLRYYNFSSICLPRPKKGFTNGAQFAREICENYGIGIFRINRYGEVEEWKAKLQRKALTQKISLYEMQKTFAEAGNSEGMRWTPFKQTIKELNRYVSDNPGCKLKDALTHIKHHYSTLSSATNSLRQMINDGVIKTISIDRGILNFKD